MERFNLKNWSIAFEVPFWDVDDTTGQDEFFTELSDSYSNWFDTLNSGFEILESQSSNGNILILYHITIISDTAIADKDTIKENWDKMKIEIQSALENFLKARNLEYRIINCIDQSKENNNDK